jgi:hypothetical protein
MYKEVINIALISQNLNMESIVTGNINSHMPPA